MSDDESSSGEGSDASFGDKPAKPAAPKKRKQPAAVAAPKEKKKRGPKKQQIGPVRAKTAYALFKEQQEAGVRASRPGMTAQEVTRLLCKLPAAGFAPVRLALLCVCSGAMEAAEPGREGVFALRASRRSHSPAVRAPSRLRTKSCIARTLRGEHPCSEWRRRLLC
jgi:hypothetical protein